MMQDMTESQTITAVHIWNDSAVQFGEHTLASGQKSMVYFDLSLRKISHETRLFIVRELSMVAYNNAVLPYTNKPPIYCAIGVPTGGDYYSGLFAAQYGLFCNVLVRLLLTEKDPSYRIVGNVEKGAGIVIIEDVVTTAGSALSLINFLEEKSHKIVAVLCIIDREEGGKEALKERDIPLHSVFTKKQLLDFYRNMGVITQEEWAAAM
jgi:orotate phosphoribosyltransferase